MTQPSKHHVWRLIRRTNRYYRDLFSTVQKECPIFTHKMIEDLLQIEGYSENEIAFASKTPLEIVRAASKGNLKQISRDHFLSLIGLYARVFSSWCENPENSFICDKDVDLKS